MSSSTKELVRGLDVGPDHPGPLELTGGPAGAVVSGSILAVDGSVSEQHQRDVLECVLLAQLAANAKAERHKDPVKWYKAYHEVLESIGWVVHASTAMSRYVPRRTGFRISRVITDLFGRKVGAEQLVLVNQTLDAFTHDPGGPGQFVFECPSHSGGIGNFQFGLATEEDDVVSLQLGCFAFTTAKHVTRLAFEEFAEDAKFQAGFLALKLNEEVYEALRSTVSAKVAGRFTGSVAPLELASG